MLFGEKHEWYGKRPDEQADLQPVSTICTALIGDRVDKYGGSQ